MVLHSSGAIALSDLRAEFNGTYPINMSDYYTDGKSFTTGVSGVPQRNAPIKLGHFYGKSKERSTAPVSGNKYPPGDGLMTANTVTISPQLVQGTTDVYYGGGTYTTSASAQYSTPSEVWGAYAAFNYMVGGAGHTGWAAPGYNNVNGAYSLTTPVTVANNVSYVGQWVQIACPSAFRLSGYSILLTADYWLPRAPRSFVVLGSNDGSTWDLLDSRADVTGYTHGVAKEFGEIKVATAYSHYRFVMMKTQGGNGSDYVSAHGIALHEW